VDFCIGRASCAARRSCDVEPDVERDRDGALALTNPGGCAYHITAQRS
jgi:hypothetical protein